MASLKTRIKNGEVPIGIMVTILDNPEMARIYANTGFDFFVVDTEHGYVDYENLQGLFAYARMSGIAGFCRVPEITKTNILKLMDMGCDGIVGPSVDNAEIAKTLVDNVKYAPIGNRGVSLTRPHTGYKKVNAVEYMKQANDDTFVICQIESLEGLENCDEIAAVEGVDVLLVGPNDLTQAMGIMGQTNHPDFIAAVEKVIAVCEKHGKWAGYPSKSITSLTAWVDKGIKFARWTSDIAIMMDACTEPLAKFKAR